MPGFDGTGPRGRGFCYPETRVFFRGGPRQNRRAGDPYVAPSLEYEMETLKKQAAVKEYELERLRKRIEELQNVKDPDTET